MIEDQPYTKRPIRLKHLVIIYVCAILAGLILTSVGVAVQKEATVATTMNVLASSLSHTAFAATTALPINEAQLARCGIILLNNLVYVCLIGLGLVYVAEWRGSHIVLVIALAVNGATLGIVAGLGVAILGIPTTVAGLVPHGIFEIPAVFMGFIMGLAGIYQIRDGVPKPEMLRMNRDFILTTILPMLTMAAVVETYITPLLMGV